ncbi:hypothetical protein HN51_039619 [Arachis hypogaea]
MDQRELHLQPLGICYKLYNFIIKTLASQALKTVTLGRPNSHYGATSTREQHAKEKNKPFKRNIIDGVVHENNNRIASLPQAPKKMVIINEE